MSLSPLLFDQVDVQLSGQRGETGTNGVIMNAIPKAGGNRFSGRRSSADRDRASRATTSPRTCRPAACRARRRR